MGKNLTQVLDVATLYSSHTQIVCIGHIVRITEEGQALVDYPGNQSRTLEARSIIEVLSTCGGDREEKTPVLLVFENGNPDLPIIVGIVRDNVRSPILQEVVRATERPREGLVDKKRIVFDAEEEIVLQCGKGSITLKRDGKIVLKGTDIVSRASRTNKIQGGSVKIN